MDTRPRNIGTTGLFLSQNFVKYHNSLGRKEASPHKQVGSSLGFNRNIGKGKEYVEAIISKDTEPEYQILNHVSEITELRVKTSIDIKKNLVLATTWMVTTENSTSHAKYMQTRKLKCDASFGFVSHLDFATDTKFQRTTFVQKFKMR